MSLLRHLRAALIFGLNSLNVLAIPLVVFGPGLVPVHSGMSRLEAAMLPISMVYLWGTGLGLWASRKFCLLTEAEERRRDFLLDYYPLWSLGSLFAFFWVLRTLAAV